MRAIRLYLGVLTFLLVLQTLLGKVNHLSENVELVANNWLLVTLILRRELELVILNTSRALMIPMLEGC